VACAAGPRFQVAACGGLVLQRAVRVLVVVEHEGATILTGCRGGTPPERPDTSSWSRVPCWSILKTPVWGPAIQFKAGGLSA